MKCLHKPAGIYLASTLHTFNRLNILLEDLFNQNLKSGQVVWPVKQKSNISLVTKLIFYFDRVVWVCVYMHTCEKQQD